VGSTRVADDSLASFVTRRFGREVLDRVAEPVLASLFMADAEKLSMAAALPRFV
jgi:oxygen-dependent protoporphyrinogen oxidase